MITTIKQIFVAKLRQVLFLKRMPHLMRSLRILFILKVEIHPGKSSTSDDRGERRKCAMISTNLRKLLSACVIIPLEYTVLIARLK